jgi:hypothetical protein
MRKAGISRRSSNKLKKQNSGHNVMDILEENQQQRQMTQIKRKASRVSNT